MIKQIVKSSIFQFVAIKYIGYAIQFVCAMLTAKYLGLFYFGIYGFTNLVLQYLSYTNLGVQYSFNVLVSTEKTITIPKTEIYLSNSIFISLSVGVLILVLTVIASFFGFLDSLDKYLFNEYFLIIIITALLQYINNIYINLFRILNKFQIINLSTILPGVLLLFCLGFFKGEILFWSLLISFLIAQFIISLFFFFSSDVKIRFKLDKEACSKLIKRGFFLLAYNLSFYLIILVARTIVSYYYTVENFAIFNFANSMSLAIMMLIGSFGFLVFPKMLNKFSTLNDEGIIDFLGRTRNIYIFGVFFVVFLSIGLLPLVFLFLPDYKGAQNAIIILLISQLILENNFGYPTLMIQRGKEKILTVFGYIAVSIVFILGTIFTKSFNLSFDFVAIAVVVSVIVYSQLVIISGNRITGQFKSKMKLYLHIYNPKFFLPLICFVLLYYISPWYFINILLVFILFIALNFKELKVVIHQTRQIFLDKRLLEIDGIKPEAIL